MDSDRVLKAELRRMLDEGEIAATGAVSIWEPQYVLTERGRARRHASDDAWNAASIRAGRGRNLRRTVQSLEQWVATYRGPIAEEER